MGEATNNEDNANVRFFFKLIHDVKDTYPAIFGGGGRTKPHSKAYRDFGETWGFQKTLFELANEEVTKVAQVKQEYLTDTFLFLTYLIQKGEMEDEEDAFQENLRKAKSKHR